MMDGADSGVVYLCELDTYAAVTKFWPQFPDFLWPTQLICPPSLPATTV